MGTILEGYDNPIGRFLAIFRYNNTIVERAAARQIWGSSLLGDLK